MKRVPFKWVTAGPLLKNYMETQKVTYLRIPEMQGNRKGSKVGERQDV